MIIFFSFPHVSWRVFNPHRNKHANLLLPSFYKLLSTGLWHTLKIKSPVKLYLIGGWFDNKAFSPSSSFRASLGWHSPGTRRRGSQRTSKPVFIPRDFTQQTINSHLMVASYYLLKFCPLKPLWGNILACDIVYQLRHGFAYAHSFFALICIWMRGTITVKTWK